MSLHATARTPRALLPLAVFSVLSHASLHAQGQRISYAGLPWGLPADSVRPRMEALGWQSDGTNPEGDPFFRKDSSRALTVIARGKLEQVNVSDILTPAEREPRLRFLVDSLTRVYGPPATSSENGSIWGSALSSLAATYRITENGASAVVVLVYLGPGATREIARRGGEADPFPALDDAWIEVEFTPARRIAMDTTFLATAGERVYRVRTRYDLTEPARAGRTLLNGLITEQEFDCARRRTRVRAREVLRPGQPSQILGPSGWEGAPAGTPDGKELDRFCALAAEYLGQ